METQAILANTGSPSAALAEIFRLVHTFKGDFAQLGLHRIVCRASRNRGLPRRPGGVKKGEHTLEEPGRSGEPMGPGGHFAG